MLNFFLNFQYPTVEIEYWGTILTNYHWYKHKIEFFICLLNIYKLTILKLSLFHLKPRHTLLRIIINVCLFCPKSCKVGATGCVICTLSWGPILKVVLAYLAVFHKVKILEILYLRQTNAKQWLNKLDFSQILPFRQFLARHHAIFSVKTC